MPIRNNLKVIMAKRGVKSYTQLSKMTGFHYATIRHFALGMHQRLDAKLVESLCSELNCELQDLLYIEKNLKGGE